jgi:hypothetical protein
LHLSYNEAVPVVDVFRFCPRYFDVKQILLRLPPKEFAALAFEFMPKTTPPFFNRYYLVLCNVFLKPDCGICVLTIVAPL